MDIRTWLCSFLACKQEPVQELIDLRNQLQSTRNQLAMSQAGEENMQSQLDFLKQLDSQRISELNSLTAEKSVLSDALTVANSRIGALQALVPEQETEITTKRIAKAIPLDGYVFHTARPDYLRGGWYSQHFDVRKFSFPGDWALKAWCQVIVDEFKPTNPKEALLAVLKWQAKNVSYMTDDVKWREGDYWSIPHEVLLTSVAGSGAYPKDKTFYEVIKSGTMSLWFNDDCESKSHLTKALATNMGFVDAKLKIPDEWVWVAYGLWTGIGHSWVVYWDSDSSSFRIYEATSSIPPNSLQSGYALNDSPSYDEYFFNNSTYLCLNPGKAVVFG